MALAAELFADQVPVAAARTPGHFGDAGGLQLGDIFGLSRVKSAAVADDRALGFLRVVR